MKSALITGSGGNLGQATVSKFIKEGYNVVGTSTHKNQPITGCKSDNFEEIAVNLADEDQAKGFVEQSILKYGSIEVAILTAGGFAKGNIEETAASDIMKQYKLNFETAYNVAQPLFTKMLERGYGRIFFIGSRPGLDAESSKGMIAYGLSKSLIFRLAELMNEEAKGKDVITSVVVPSIIDTPENRKSMPEADFKGWVKPESIAEVIYYYCTDGAAILKEPVIKVYNNS